MTLRDYLTETGELLAVFTDGFLDADLAPDVVIHRHASFRRKAVTVTAKDLYVACSFDGCLISGDGATFVRCVFPDTGGAVTDGKRLLCADMAEVSWE